MTLLTLTLVGVLAIFATMAGLVTWLVGREDRLDRLTAGALRELELRHLRRGWEGPRWRLPGELGRPESPINGYPVSRRPEPPRARPRD